MEDGDRLTGIDDGQYQTAANALSRRKPSVVLEALIAALEAGEAIDRNYTTQIIDSIFVLLGENHKITQKYRTAIGD